MNVYDSVKMKDLLAPFGYSECQDMTDADMVILNTCHIREKAAEKMYSELGRIKKLKDAKNKASNDLIIAVAGCVGQAEGEEIFARAPYVDIVVGPQSYHTLPELIAKIARREKHLIELDFIEEAKFDKLTQELSPQGPSAFISIQEGCDKFCTFCVVPYTRGAEFSRPLEQVYREILGAVNNGSKEIYLLGQNVNAYHGKNHENQDCSLATLIKYIAQIPNLKRIRYTTSHPMDMTDDLIELHRTESKLMPWLHLPVQSGSDKILKAMNRRHDRKHYLQIIEKIRKTRPDIALSSDFIVGFPGETDEDFADTVSLVKELGLSQCYSFPYSPRPGTPAASKPQVPDEVRNSRLKILQETIAMQQAQFNQDSIGKIMPVLFDRDGKLDGQIIGKTPYMQSVFIEDANKNLYNNIVDVKITGARSSSLTGEVVSQDVMRRTA